MSPEQDFCQSRFYSAVGEVVELDHYRKLEFLATSGLVEGICCFG